MVTIHSGSETQCRCFCSFGPSADCTNFLSNTDVKLKGGCTLQARQDCITLRKISLNILFHRLFSGSFMAFPDLQNNLCFPSSKHSEMFRQRAETHQTVCVSEYRLWSERNIFPLLKHHPFKRVTISLIFRQSLGCLSSIPLLILFHTYFRFIPVKKAILLKTVFQIIPSDKVLTMVDNNQTFCG